MRSIGTVLFLFVDRLELFAGSEEKRDTPDSRKGNDCIDYTAYKTTLTAAQPRNDIKLEKTYASPVKGADDGQYERYSVHYHLNIPPSNGISVQG